MTQTNAILSHLKSGHSITAIEALDLFQCFRLAGRINDLRKEGHNIKTTTIHRGGKSYALYSLNEAMADAYKVQGELLSA